MSEETRGDPLFRILPRSQALVPSHAFDTRTAPGRGTTVTLTRDAIFEVLERLKQLTPCSRNPHRFHELKDELAAALYTLATAPAAPVEAR